MKPKTARRFLNRNSWRIAGYTNKGTSPSFWRRVNQAKAIINPIGYKEETRKKMSIPERIFHMFNL